MITLDYKTLILVFLLILMALFTLAWIIGTMNVARQNRFDNQVKQIDFSIQTSPVTPGNFELIERMFKMIVKLPESIEPENDKKLNKLFNKFSNKFRNLNKAV